MQMIKRISLFVCTGAVLLLLTGCSGKILFEDYREIDQMELIQTVGVDKSGDLITATAASSDMGGMIVLKNTSATISRALREMQNYTSKKYVFYGHTKDFVLGEEAARDGLDLYMEYMERGVELRLDTKLYVVKDGTAEQIISEAGVEEGGIGNLLQSVERDVELLSESYVFGCGEVAEMISEDGCGLVAAIMHINEEDIVQGGSESTVFSAGYAVFKDARLQCFIDRYFAHGVNLLIGKMGGDIIEVPDGEGSVTALRLTDSGVDYSAQFENGELKKIIIDVKVHGNIDELKNRINIYDDAVIKRLEKGLAETEKYRIENVVGLSRGMKADFCKIWKKIAMKYPIKFSKIENEWIEQFCRADVEVKVEGKIIRTYDVGLSPIGGWREKESYAE